MLAREARLSRKIALSGIDVPLIKIGGVLPSYLVEPQVCLQSLQTRSCVMVAAPSLLSS